MPGRVDFNREIRPIFSDHCYACHGPDERTRKAGLRLDQQDEAFKTLKSGHRAIVPGDVSKSELVARIVTHDADDLMPPSKGGKPLSAQQIATLRRWVEQGAEWKGHWAYIKPQRPQPPKVRNSSWVRNDIDAFVAAKIESKQLEPSPEADKPRLLRRVSLDLTGLPPTPEELDAFLSDKDPKAYEKVVDRLLDSKHYGERMAQNWLDLARYGETQGYHHDAHRDMFHWRDWVIKAFNENLPFDRFTQYQIAGDLLPNPTRDQMVATGFQRNEMTTSEGGAIPEEYAVKYIVGRVDTASRVWLGTSMACAECHDHKYDPISQKDYYRFFAFFNTVDEHGMDQSSNPVPRVPLSTSDQEKRLDQYRQEIAALELAQNAMLDPVHDKHDAAQAVWEDRLRSALASDWKSDKPTTLHTTAGAVLSVDATNVITATGTNAPRDVYEVVLNTSQRNLTGLRLETLPSSDLPGRAAGRDDKGGFVLTRIEAEATPQDPKAETALLHSIPASPWSQVVFPASADLKEAFAKEFGPESPTASTPDWTRMKIESLDLSVDLAATQQVSYLQRTLNAPDRLRLTAKLDFSGPTKVWLNGQVIFSRDSTKQSPTEADPISLTFAKGENRLLIKAVHVAANSKLTFSLHPAIPSQQTIVFTASAADYSQPGFSVSGALDNKIETGWSVGGDADQATKPHQAWFRTGEPFDFATGTSLKVRLLFQSPQPFKNLGRFRLATSSSPHLADVFALSDPIRNALLPERSDRSQSQRDELRRYYRRTFIPEAKQLSDLLAAKRSERDAFQGAIPVAMVMKEMEKPRDTFLLVRGEYNNRGDKVTPGVPQSLFGLPDALPPNRLGLAQWLVHPDNPLTSRVIVNQYWQRFFGTGIVKTSEDFGSQGEWPSHPELLDWLATEFIRSGWNIKAMQRLIVTSATYRQGSAVSRRALEVDPEDRLLSRFPRQRLDAEGIRDTALAVSGLLNPAIGGPSVFPYQPPGLWEQVSFEGTRNWVQSEGNQNYRRGLYTYWRRSVPYASFVTFDAPSRETCTVRRPRTNTPLQALVLMNDPVYVEAARSLGLRILRSPGKTPADKVRFAVRTTLSREASKKELSTLLAAFQRELKQFEKDRTAANQLIHVGASRPPVDVDPSELAAWTVVGSILLNLDETITKG